LVEQLVATTAHPSFRHAVLPDDWMLVRLGFSPVASEEAKDVGVELCVTIQNDVPQRANLRKNLTQLLDDPLRR
jgi:hypothetical protein